MNLRDFLVITGSKIGLFIGQFIVLVLCIWYIQFIYYDDILPDKTVKENYVQTSCVITNKVLTEHGRIVHTYRADFLVSYLVGGDQYVATTSANGLDRSFRSNRVAEEELLNQFDIHDSYPCWYNPEFPQLVVLVLRHHWSSTFPLFIPSVIAFVMIYYLTRSLFVFLGIVSVKTREKIRRRKRR
ncbi:MAG TPA: hypothetical protein VJL60_02645 [Gammaproteobacteria bacterium]|nr:hypothetical protein [Gammaproteobacteria bacterium]